MHNSMKPCNQTLHTFILQSNYDYLEDCNPYILPAADEEELYIQLEDRKIRKIPLHQIE